MRVLFCAILTIVSISLSGRGKKANIYSLPIPKNIAQCFATLDKAMSDQEINLIKILPEDSLYSNSKFQNGTNFFHAWKLHGGSDLTRYFHKKKLYGSYEMYQIILTSYHRYLNKIKIDFDGQIKRHHAEQEANKEIHIARLNKDYLMGFYIPSDIEDCMLQLDKIIDQDTKERFKIQEESKTLVSAYLFNPGSWIRNNWGLSGGSRLQKYFFDQGVEDPEAMSWIILTCFYHYQKGTPIDIEKQVSIEKQGKREGRVDPPW